MSMDCNLVHTTCFWKTFHQVPPQSKDWQAEQFKSLQNFRQRIFLPKLFFLTILAFTIYKSYYVSEQKTKKNDVYLLFKNEFQRKMKENKLLGMNSLFKNILNKLWLCCMQ